MPLLTRASVRTNLIYPIVGLLLAIATSSGLHLPADLPVAVLRPISIHFLTIGWLTQLIMGVMHWMFPKASQERPRGNEQLVRFSFRALNAGLLLRAVAEPGLATTRVDLWMWLLVGSAVLQWLAALTFVANTWGRVRVR